MSRHESLARRPARSLCLFQSHNLSRLCRHHRPIDTTEHTMNHLIDFSNFSFSLYRLSSFPSFQSVEPFPDSEPAARILPRELFFRVPVSFHLLTELTGSVRLLQRIQRHFWALDIRHVISATLSREQLAKNIVLSRMQAAYYQAFEINITDITIRYADSRKS